MIAHTLETFNLKRIKEICEKISCGLFKIRVMP